MAGGKDEAFDERRQEIERLLTEANLLRLRLQFEEAEALCHKILNLDPNCSEAHEILGEIHRSLGRLEEAMEEFKKAIELDPKNVRAQTALAETSLLLAEQRAEEKRLKETIEKRPPRAERSPTLAALYSLIAPGLGQVYNGDLLKGLAFITLFLAIASCIGFLLSASAAGLSEEAEKMAQTAVRAAFPYYLLRAGRPISREETSLAYRATMEAVKSVAPLIWRRAQGDRTEAERLLYKAASRAVKSALRATTKGLPQEAVRDEARRAALSAERGEFGMPPPSPLALLPTPAKKAIYLLGALLACLYIYAFFDAVRRAAEAPLT